MLEDSAPGAEALYHALILSTCDVEPDLHHFVEDVVVSRDAVFGSDLNDQYIDFTQTFFFMRYNSVAGPVSASLRWNLTRSCNAMQLRVLRI
jgi:hypothetical protein